MPDIPSAAVERGAKGLVEGTWLHKGQPYSDNAGRNQWFTREEIAHAVLTAALRLDDPEPLVAWLFTEFAHRPDPQIAWVNVTGYRRDFWLGKARAAIRVLLGAEPEEAED